MHIELHNGCRVLVLGSLARLLRPRLRILKLLLVDAQAQFLRHQRCKVHREAVGIVEPPDVLAVQLFEVLLLGALRVLVEELLAAVKRPCE